MAKATRAGGRDTGASDTHPDHGRPGTASGRRRGEARLPAALAIAVAIALYTLLPESLIVGPRFIAPALEAALLVAVVVVNPRRMTRETRWSRAASVGLVLLILVTNLVALGLLVHLLVSSPIKHGRDLLTAALQVWATNIIVFGLAFWEIDRGGPVVRTRYARSELPAADFRFSQDENDDTVDEVSMTSSRKSDWVPSYIDYLYVSVTNSTAFSPTDTMPLSPRAKLLMSIEAISALLVSVLVIARGVSILQ